MLLESLSPLLSIVVTALEAHVDDLTMDFEIHHEQKLKAHESKPEALRDSALVKTETPKVLDL